MPFVVDATEAHAVSTSVTVGIPGTHKAGDLLIVVAQNDTGTGTLSASSSSSWTNAFSTGQFANASQRTYAWYRIATSDDESPVTVTSTISDDLAVVVVVVRGVNQTNPINASAIAGRSVSVNMTLPSVTTTSNNCLIVCGVGTDHSSSSHYANARDFTRISGVNYGAGAVTVAWFNKRQAGAISTAGFANFGAAGGHTFAIAIADDGNGAMRSTLLKKGQVLRLNGNFGAGRGDPSVTWEAPFAAFTSLDGIPCQNALTTSTTSTESGVSFNGDVSAIPEGNWMGGFMVFPSSVDMSGALFAAWVYVFNMRSQYFTNEQFALYFVDENNNYRSFRLVTSSYGYQTGASFQVLIDVENFPPRYQSGAMDWSKVKKIGLLFRKVGINSGDTGFFRLGEMALYRSGDFIIDSGLNQNEVTIGAEIDSICDGWGGSNLAASQGSGQGVVRMPMQFGSSNSSAVFRLAGVSLEDEQSYKSTLARRFFMVNENPTAWVVDAAAGSSIDLSGGLLVGNTGRKFVVATTTSPSANINFSGALLKGFEPVHNASGVVIRGATFLACKTATLNGGMVDECVFSSAIESPVVRTSNPGNISNCTFVQGDAGHAIEITQPGTYSFVGNTFEGYGVDGSTDAAIYNNSGGAVTLNISGGGSTPTVRNGAGASTTINNNVTITLSNVVVGSSIRVERADNGSLIEFRVADASTEAFSVAGSVEYRIKVRKASAPTRYKPWETTVTPTGDVPITVAQVSDE